MNREYRTDASGTTTLRGFPRFLATDRGTVKYTLCVDGVRCKPGWRISCCLAALLWALPTSQAQPYRWQAYVLHDDDFLDSKARAVDVDMACGNLYRDAALWPSLDPLFVNLKPDGAISAFVRGADEGTQGGTAAWSLQYQPPALWRSTQESFIDVTPDGPYANGEVNAVTEEQAVGYTVAMDGLLTAILWSVPNPDEFVALEPSWADWSDAWSTDGVWQGGRVASTANGGLQIGYWKGTPESWTRLDGPGIDGNVFGMAPGTQVGYVVRGNSRATLWHNTPESVVDMHPDGAIASRLYATTGGMHVGYADAPGESTHARLWLSDDPHDNLDLHQFVPEEYALGASAAYDISVVDGVIYIAGGVSVSRTKACLWVGRPIDSTDAEPPPKKPQFIGPHP